MPTVLALHSGMLYDV